MFHSLFFICLAGLFGNFFALQVLRTSRNENLLSKNQMTKIGTGFFCVHLATLFVFYKNHNMVFCIIILVPITLRFLIFYFYKRLDIQFQSDFPGIVNLIVLQMKSGSGFRLAIKSAAEQCSGVSGHWLEQTLNFVVFSQQKLNIQSQYNKLFVIKLRSKFAKIDQEAHKTIEKLEALSRNTKILNEFRRRSGKIRAQIYFQLIVLVGMYLAVAAFVAHTFGFQKNILIFFTSFLLLALSCVWSFFIGRKIKWTI